MGAGNARPGGVPFPKHVGVSTRIPLPRAIPSRTSTCQCRAALKIILIHEEIAFSSVSQEDAQITRDF